MGLQEMIRDEARGLQVDAEKLVIEQALNKLFYLPNDKRELHFLGTKRGHDAADRVGLHASSIIVPEKEFCYREQVLSLFYKQAQGGNIPIKLKRIFLAGDVIHEKWQRLFIRGNMAATDALDKSHFHEEYELSYTPDGAPVIIAKNKYVVEIKSMNTYQFKNCKSHPSGEKQLKFYMWLTGIYKGFVLVEDKNTQKFKVIMVKYDPADIEPYIERLEGIQEYKARFMKLKKMVARICNDSICKRAAACNMKDACFNIGMGRVKLCRDVQ